MNTADTNPAPEALPHVRPGRPMQNTKPPLVSEGYLPPRGSCMPLSMTDWTRDPLF